MLRQRLGLFLDHETQVIEDAEAFDVTGLEKYHLDQELVETRLKNKTPDILKSRLQSGGTLPPGAVGDVYFNRELASADGFVEAARELVSEDRMRRCPLMLHWTGSVCRALSTLFFLQDWFITGWQL